MSLPRPLVYLPSVLLVSAAWLLLRGISVIPASLLHGLLYYPDPILIATPDEAGLAYEDVFVTTDDGVTVHGWFLPHPQPQATLYFLHGNAGNISQRLAMLERLHGAGYQIFILDYRGYGRSEGEPSERGTYADALAGWHWLHERVGEEDAPLILYGRSLGGAVAAWLAVQPGASPDGVVLESTFSSVRAMAGVVAPFPGLGRLLANVYPTVERVGQLHSPLLLIHGDRDEVVPVSHVNTLYAAAAEPKTLYIVSGALHNNVLFVAGDAYLEQLGSFVASLR